MAQHINIGTSTQVAHPWKATVRTGVAYLLAAIAFLAAALPILTDVMGDYLPASWQVWLTGAVAFLVAVATLITRLMSLAKAQNFLAKVGLGTGVEKEPLSSEFDFNQSGVEVGNWSVSHDADGKKISNLPPGYLASLKKNTNDSKDTK